jgi:hypothetical protein
MVDERKDRQALEDFLKEYSVDFSKRSVFSYALEFLKTERANAKHYQTLLNVQGAANSFSQACEYLKSSQRWLDESIEKFQKIKLDKY